MSVVTRCRWIEVGYRVFPVSVLAFSISILRTIPLPCGTLISTAPLEIASKIGENGVFCRRKSSAQSGVVDDDIFTDEVHDDTFDDPEEIYDEAG